MSDPSNRDLQRQLNAIQDAVNWGDQQTAEILRILKPRIRSVVGLILSQQTGVLLTMSGSNSETRTLINACNPALATRALEVIDVIGGTALPSVTVTSNNGSLVSIVGPTAIASGENGTEVTTFGVYPIDTSPETNDVVTVAASLADGSSITYTYTINGTGESLAPDPNSSVGAWANAPLVPSTPT
jgi:hypothetical protein